MASSIKLFQFTQYYIRATDINLSESQNKNCFAINWKNVIFSMSAAQYIAALSARLLFGETSMLEFGAIFFAIAGIIGSLVVYIINLREIKNRSKFIENCERFIEKRECSTIAYEDLSKKIELFSKLFDFGLLMNVVIMNIALLIFTIMNYWIFGLGSNSFYLIFPAAYPFDWKTPVGYPVAWISQLAGSCIAIICAAPLINLFFGSCWLFIYIAKDITEDLMAFNSNKVENKNHVEELKRFCDIVQLYSDAKQHVIAFNEVHKYSLFVIFVWALISVCCILVTIQFQLWDENSKSIEIAIPSLLAAWVFILIFLFCEPGERVTTQFEIVSKELERSSWYKLSIGVQRVYLMFLLDTQQPINTESYGGIQCTRETFRKVITKGYSYFAALRKMK